MAEDYRLHRGTLATALALCAAAVGCSPAAGSYAGGHGLAIEADAGAPMRHLVRRGDTVALLALRYGTTVEALAAANGLGPPYTIRVGEELTLPAGAVDRVRTYVVRPGDTLAEIAARFGTTVRALADASGITNPNHVVAGETLLVMPDALVPRRSPRRPSRVAAVRRASTGPALLAPVDRGEVVAGFAEAGGGIEIAAEAGAPVRAVAGGEVVYAGPGGGGVAGVVLLRHDDGDIAVYARAAEVLVAQGDRVPGGAVIARLPDRDRPRLRFELRADGRQVDPSFRLPAIPGPAAEVREAAADPGAAAPGAAGPEATAVEGVAEDRGDEADGAAVPEVLAATGGMAADPAEVDGVMAARGVAGAGGGRGRPGAGMARGLAPPAKFPPPGEPPRLPL